MHDLLVVKLEEDAEKKKAHDNALSTSLSEQLDYERDAQEVLLDKKEFKEGVSAFVGKRKPNFRDLS